MDGAVIGGATGGTIAGGGAGRGATVATGIAGVAGAGGAGGVAGSPAGAVGRTGANGLPMPGEATLGVGEAGEADATDDGRANGGGGTDAGPRGPAGATLDGRANGAGMAPGTCPAEVEAAGAIRGVDGSPDAAGRPVMGVSDSPPSACTSDILVAATMGVAGTLGGSTGAGFAATGAAGAGVETASRGTDGVGIIFGIDGAADDGTDASGVAAEGTAEDGFAGEGVADDEGAVAGDTAAGMTGPGAGDVESDAARGAGASTADPAAELGSAATEISGADAASSAVSAATSTLCGAPGGKVVAGAGTALGLVVVSTGARVGSPIPCNAGVVDALGTGGEYADGCETAAGWRSPRASEPAAMEMMPPHTEQRARTRAPGILRGSTRNTEWQSRQETFIAGLPSG